MKNTILSSFVVLMTTLLLSTGLSAADKNKNTKDEMPPPPAMSTPSANDYPDDLEPEVTIVPKEKETHQEYRLNGRLYMIKVIPAKGPPYYLIDREGHGDFTRSDLAPDISVPMWVIKEF
ncbi:MAG: DUF2782 domain-containing protein [Gammaproteobacteria bacterium]|nr:DUF2782 domain-containing protein [Gammaproteobacteria bacterium]